MVAMKRDPPANYRMLRGTTQSANGEFTICSLVCGHPPMWVLPHELEGEWQSRGFLWCSHCAQEAINNAQTVVRTASAQ